MGTRDQLLQSIAATAADYRLKSFSSEHVDTWVRQFKKDVQIPVLREMDHVLGRTYYSRSKVQSFLEGMLIAKPLVGKDPATYWKGVSFLNIQGGGASQDEMLALVDQPLKALCGVGTKDCGGENPTTFAYIDDVLCTGGRVLRDLKQWIATEAPPSATLHVIVIALHTQGYEYATRQIEKAAHESGKKIKVEGWRSIALETSRERLDPWQRTFVATVSNLTARAAPSSAAR